MKFLLPLILSACLTGCGEDRSSEKQVDKGPEMEQPVSQDTTPRVTGIGGIFILSKDPESLNRWYGDHLGLALDNYGSAFEFRNANRPSEINYLRWSTFPDSTNYLAPSDKEFMINYRVHRLEALVAKLRESGVTVLDSVTLYDYGKFVHLLDPEGNKIELWEPVDSVLTNMGGPTTK